jgi:hypothetical protein
MSRSHAKCKLSNNFSAEFGVAESAIFMRFQADFLHFFVGMSGELFRNMRFWEVSIIAENCEISDPICI